MRKASLLALALVFSPLAGCGEETSNSPPEDTVSDSAGDAADSTGTLEATVGPEGATLSLPGGGSLEIPPGALTDNVEIHIGTIPTPLSLAFTSRGIFYSFEPSGLAFQLPATLTLIVTPINPIDGLSLAWKEADGDWFKLPGEVDSLAGTIRAEINGFSQGGPAVFFQSVCCTLKVPQGTMARVLAETECQQWAEETPDSSVTSTESLDECLVCCIDDGSVHQVDQCQSPYDYLEGCEEVCCQDGDTATLSNRMDCGAVAGDASMCDLVCCHNQTYIELNRWKCLSQGGDPLSDLQQCQQVCCLQGGTSKLTLGGFCEGEAFPAAECDPVCCNTNGTFSTASRVVCGDGGGTAAPSMDACDLACCFKNGNPGVVLPKGECSGANVITVAPEQCDLVCCQSSNGFYAQIDLYSCTSAQGVEVSDDSLCNPVCCVSDGASPSVELRGNCVDYVAMLEDTVQCEAVCCLQGSTYSTVTLYECGELTGSVSELAEMCTPTCCQTEGSLLVKEAGNCTGENETLLPEALVCGTQCCLPPASTCAQAACDQDGACATQVKPEFECATAQDCSDGFGCSQQCLCMEGLPPGTFPGEEAVNPKDGAIVVWVPPGAFLMGLTDAQGLQLWDWYWTPGMYGPQRAITLTQGFWIYKYEVTVGQYKNFVNDSVCDMPQEPEWGFADNEPIHNGVTWSCASAYAQWAGGLLPTSAQWEKAARGTDGRVFPWGDAWSDASCANWSNCMVGVPAGPDIQNLGPAPVGTYATDTSPYGVMDMAGNAMEWVRDALPGTGSDYDDIAAVDPIGSITGSHYGRGGDWTAYDPSGATHACAYYATEMLPEGGTAVGFRCVLMPVNQ